MCGLKCLCRLLFITILFKFISYLIFTLCNIYFCNLNPCVGSWVSVVWENWEAVHARKGFRDMLKSQMWRNSCFGEFLLVDTYFILYCFLDEYKCQETHFCKLGLFFLFVCLFACLLHMTLKTKAWNITYLIFKYPNIIYQESKY